ncbi:hypothetical protein [Spirillospora albida]|uniref:hypothetical protein n=1 Tax=Spirillospora albida TaxID=58123 RepID=UPI0004C072B4|nr:hypothetical protein [Spirillospora albida]
MPAAPQADVLVFDTGPLSHFAKQNWLGCLRAVVGRRRAVVPDTVVAEVQAAVPLHPHLQPVLEASWIEQYELTAEYEEFAEFSALLVGSDGRNTGEAGVLAYAKAHDAVAIIDDGAARNAAGRKKVTYRGTLGLLCDGVRDGLLTLDLVSELADQLIEGDYRLPFAPGEFKTWARNNLGLGG